MATRIGLTPRTFELLTEELREAREAYAEEATLYENPECPYCGRETETGMVGSGKIKFGCYHDDCDIKEEKSKYSYYSKEVTTAPATQARARLEAILDVYQQLAREDREQIQGH